MPASDNGNVAPDAGNTSNEDIVEELAANRKSEDQPTLEISTASRISGAVTEDPSYHNSHLNERSNMEELSNELVGAREQEYSNLPNIVTLYFPVGGLRSEHTSKDPRLLQVVRLIGQREQLGNANAMTDTNLTKQHQVVEPNRKRVEQPPQDDSAAGPSTSHTAAYSQSLTAKADEDPVIDQLAHYVKLYNFARQVYATSVARSNVTKPKDEQKAYESSSRGKTATVPTTSDTMTRKDNQNAAKQPPSEDPTCCRPWFERMQKLVREKAMRQRRRERAARRAARENSQVPTIEDTSDCDPSSESTNNSHSAMATECTDPKDTKDSAGYDLKGGTMTSFSKDASVPMPIHDGDVSSRIDDLLIGNGFMWYVDHMSKENGFPLQDNLYTRINKLCDSATLKQILQAETTVSQMERTENSKMASEVLQKLEALREQCLDQISKYQKAITHAKQLRIEMVGMLARYYGVIAESGNEPRQDEP